MNDNNYELPGSEPKFYQLQSDIFPNDDFRRNFKEYLDGIPRICPKCKHKILPLVSSASKINDDLIQVSFKCANCLELFITKYQKKGKYYEVISSEPQYPSKMDINPIIQELSNDFIEIYSQSKHSEEIGLLLIAGIGYRKALEFLIKDYLIKHNGIMGIEDIFLGTCINQYVEDDKIKKVAIRAAWLGNDETHYYRKHTDKDINDLKTLIELTIHWICSSIETERYLKEMPEEKRKK